MYWKNTTDLLLDVPLPDFTGGGSILKNMGEVFNGGWEFSLDGNIITKDNFDWDASFNYSHNESEVKALADAQNEILISPVGRVHNVANTTGGFVRLKVGEPLGQFYGATSLGTYKVGDTDGTPGEAKYLKNEDGEVELGVIGNGVPKHTWALNNTLNFGRFDLNFLLMGSHGFDVLNFTRAKISMGGGNQSLPTYGEYRNRWTPENQTEIPTGGDLFVNATRFVEKGDFIRLNNLALGYNMPESNYFKSFRVYVSAQNLFVITDYKGYDPEASSIGVGSGAASSIDYGANPNPRIITMGVNIGL